MPASKSIFPVTSAKQALSTLAGAFLFICALHLPASTGGGISGSVAEPSGAVISGAALCLVNTAQQTTHQAVSDASGYFSFPNLPVGHYNLTISAVGFRTLLKTNLKVDTDSALRVDASLVLGAHSDTVVVSGELGIEVDLNDFVPPIIRMLRRRLAHDGAGVVDENIDLEIFGVQLLDQAVERGAI